MAAERLSISVRTLDRMLAAGTIEKLFLGASVRIRENDIEKLDKGCIIFNTSKADGYRLLSVDSNNYDSEYWIHHFVHVAVLNISDPSRLEPTDWNRIVDVTKRVLIAPLKRQRHGNRKVTERIRLWIRHRVVPSVEADKKTRLG